MIYWILDCSGIFSEYGQNNVRGLEFWSYLNIIPEKNEMHVCVIVPFLLSLHCLFIYNSPQLVTHFSISKLFCSFCIVFVYTEGQMY
jgi:hypothetical protein